MTLHSCKFFPTKKACTKGAVGIKAHISVESDSDLMHTVCGTAGNVNDVVQANSLLLGKENVVCADAGYQGAAKQPDTKREVIWRIAMRSGKRRALDKDDEIDALIEKLKGSVRGKDEHPFRVIKRQFGHGKVRYRGLAKNTA